LWLVPGQALADSLHKTLEISLARESRAIDLLKRPEVSYQHLMSVPGIGPGVADAKVAEQVEVQVRYAGYIGRQSEEISRHQRNEMRSIPADIDYLKVPGLSSEVREKLALARPGTVGLASRVPGVTPAAISLLLVHLKRHAEQRKIA
jgi:tRNA uridine 5-carboxymethylaminomethyl modification enzyme